MPSLATKVAACLGAQMCALCASSLIGGFVDVPIGGAAASWLYYTTLPVLAACVGFIRVMFFRQGVRRLLALGLAVLTADSCALCWLLSATEVRLWQAQASWSFAMDDDDDAHEQRMRERGQKALCLVWALLMLSFAGAVYALVFHPDDHHEEAAASGAIAFATHNAGVMLMLGAAGVAVFNDREWDWRYAFAIALAICVSSYIAGSLSWCWSTLCKQQDCWQRVVGGLLLLPVFVLEDCWDTLVTVA